MVLTNTKTGDNAKIHFSKQGWTKKKKCKVEGHVFDAKGKEKVYIHGNWHEKIIIKDMVKGTEETVWNASPKVPNHERQYAFNRFICNLNYIDDEMKKVIAPTDTRLRPDQRFFE